MQSISPQMYPQLTTLINAAYAGCVESIVSAGLDGNNDIVCIVRGREKQLTVTIEDDNDAIVIQDLEPI